MDLDHHGQATQRLLPKGMALRQGPLQKNITSHHQGFILCDGSQGFTMVISVPIYNHIRVYIFLYNKAVIWQWIWTIKLSCVIIRMVGAKLTRCHRISQFLKPGLQRRVYAAPNHNSTRSREWWTIGGTTGQKCSTLWYYMILPYINTMKYKWFTQFDKAFVLVPSWLSPWLMAMSAKSRLECSLLVVVVGVSICDTILGGTKQTRHAAWILCKVMSRIGNFCGAVRGYFHNVMHTSEELLWLFYILSLFFYHPLTWNMFWQCMAMLHPKDCMQFHTSSVAQSISNRRWVNTAEKRIDSIWFIQIWC